MPTTIDSATLLLTFLAANTALMTYISNRLDGPPLGIPEGAAEPVAALRLSRDGGAGDESLPVSQERFTFHAYGATQEGAGLVFRLLNDALHRAQGQSVTVSGATWRLIYATRESGPTDLPEPEIEWPRVVCAYRVTMAEWAIT